MFEDIYYRTEKKSLSIVSLEKIKYKSIKKKLYFIFGNY